MSDVQHAYRARMTRPRLAGGTFNESVALLSTELRKTNKHKYTATLYVYQYVQGRSPTPPPSHANDSLSHLATIYPRTVDLHIWQVNPSTLASSPHKLIALYFWMFLHPQKIPIFPHVSTTTTHPSFPLQFSSSSKTRTSFLLHVSSSSKTFPSFLLLVFSSSETQLSVLKYVSLSS